MDTKRDPEHIGGNQSVIRPYLFGKGTIRTARTSRDIPIVLSDTNPVIPIL